LELSLFAFSVLCKSLWIFSFILGFFSLLGRLNCARNLGVSFDFGVLQCCSSFQVSYSSILSYPFFRIDFPPWPSTSSTLLPFDLFGFWQIPYLILFRLNTFPFSSLLLASSPLFSPSKPFLLLSPSIWYLGRILHPFHFRFCANHCGFFHSFWGSFLYLGG